MSTFFPEHAGAGERAPRAAAPRSFRFPPGLERNLLWFAFRKFRPQDPIALFTYLAEHYGDLAHYRIGPAHIVFANHPQYVAEILIRQPEKFIKERTQQRSKMLLGEGMITAEGAAHRQQRQTALPAFHRQRIAEYAATIVERAAAMRDAWPQGAEFDIAPEMMRLTLDIVSRTLFGADLGAEVRRVVAAINRIMRLYNYLVALPAAEVLVHVPLSGLGDFRRARAEVDEVIYRMIEERRRGAQRQDDLLGMMLAAEPEADRKRLRDQVVTILLAGYETVANAMIWTWYLLAQNPEAEGKLHRELDAVLAGRLPTFDDVARLPYTEAVFAESLRIYPPAWAMGRQAVAPFTLGEYFLPPRTTVLISQFLLHRDPRFFPEPLAFRPERFAPEARAGIARFAYLPFGAGARRCIGESFAWMEGVLLLATFAQRWKLEVVPGQRVEPEPLITLRPRHGLKVRCLPR